MKFLVRLAALCALLCLASPLYAQQGALMPPVHPTFFNASGAVVANGFVCTTVTGTTTSQITYQDSALTIANQNPIRLNGLGRAVNGSNEVSIYLQPKQYRITLYGPGIGNTCNGTTVGALINQADNVYDLFSISVSSICQTSQQVGITLDLRVNACAAILPATGGIIDARGDQGAQAWSSAITLSKPVQLLFGASTITCAVTTVSGCLTLTSEGSSIIGLGRTETVFVMSNTTGVGINLSSNKQRIEHMTVRGGCTTSCAVFGTPAIGINGGSNADVLINDVTVEKWSNIGVDTGGGVTNWQIVNSTFQDIFGDAVFLAAGSGHVVENVTCNRVGSNCADINSSSSTIKTMTCNGVGFNLPNGGIDSNCVVISSIQGSTNDNEVTGIKSSGGSGSAVRVRGDAGPNTASRNRIHHNVSSGAVGSAFAIDVSVGGTCGTTNNNIFDHNIAYGTTGVSSFDFGIAGGAGTPCIATGNIFDTNVSMSTTSGYGVAIAWGTSNKIINSTFAGTYSVQAVLTAGSSNTSQWCNQLSLGATPPSCIMDIILPSAVESTIQSGGNTGLIFHSTGGGSYRDYAVVIDSSGNFFPAFDNVAGAGRIKVDNAGNVTFLNSAISTLTSTGNTQLSYTSSGAGTRNYASLIDNSGNFFPAFDLVSNAGRIKVDSAGNVSFLSDTTTILNSTGNTELSYTSSAGGTRNYASVIDTSGNFFPVIDVTAGNASRIKVDSSGNVFFNSGTNVVFRCATAGAVLPAGTLTITAAACGTTTDTGLRVP